MISTLAGALVFFALMAALFRPLEAWWPAAPVTERPRALAACLALFVANTLLTQAVGAPLFDALSDAVGAVEPPRPATWVLVFVLSDAAGALIHLAMHRVPWLWSFHAVHHAPRELCWAEAWRQHPVDFLLHGLVVGLPGALLGASLSDVLAVVLLRKAYTTFLHANLDVRFPGVLGLVLASPAFHRLHHGALPEHHDRNFAGTFPVWDLLLGTHAGAAREVVEVGLPASR